MERTRNDVEEQGTIRPSGYAATTQPALLLVPAPSTNPKDPLVRDLLFILSILLSLKLITRMT